MPRSMAHPEYRYKPWTPERRKAASEAAKRRWAEKRAFEEQEYHQRERQGASGLLRQVRNSKSSEMADIVSRWHRLKAEVEEIDTTLKLIEQIRPVLQKYRINGG